ncbi:molybdopterin molybdotransferase MoeA [Xinfangfangia sp. CPCC 101601]|uniref:Molybdopterin molybdenumtransferase n=1 Tax=Pseudogemmobacter lacusdianii TaxID=3069608 RepID=A0ABU0W0M1_9RHOB|nr:molybdopterin molybdotransferase MoeA [Xinfangfangia sp. CPCC 101601]MDQ2067561.1 molybdopterin molybdotransferase MoeA [Xinfangfangia sp. CPCC 101601]
MISVEEAQARVLAMAGPVQIEEIALAQSAGRWLARPVAAKADQPPFDASAMDGYAVNGAADLGARFTVIGEAGAGHGFAGTLAPGQALRIFTGAPVPAGATGVVIQENIARDGDQITLTDAERGSNIRLRGADFPAGATLAPRRLRPADLALLAAMNLPRLPVARRPVLAILMTGDELAMPGETPRPDQIIASNGFALKAMAEAEGAEVRLLPIARDSEASLRQSFALAEGADIITTIGGASVGDHDLVGKIARDLGMAPAFWKIAMRPGKPLMAGRLGHAAMLGLPGNPVSAIVTGHLFLLPLIRAMQGDPAPLPVQAMARLTVDLPANGPRSHYMRARLTAEGITPFEKQDSSLLTILTEANALLLRPLGDGPQPAGALVPYLPL